VTSNVYNKLTLQYLPPLITPLLKVIMSQNTSTFTPGRLCISLIAGLTTVGAYLADWNESHIYNHRWPAHAKFHNGQTMSMGLALGLSSFYYLYRPQYNKDSVFTAALLCSMYWITQASAILYPGTAWVDPEFGTNAPQPRDIPIFLGIVWLGYWLETRRLAGLKLAQS
jgi:hypothetical protein